SRVSRTLSLAMMGIATIASCGVDSSVDEPVAVAKIAPASVSEAGGWALFDRSVASAYKPGGRTLVATFGRKGRLVAIQGPGPSPVRIEVRGRDGAPLGFDPLDISSGDATWQALASAAPVLTDRVEISFDVLASGAAVPELELWAASDGALSAKPDLAA